jgi:hypothetical protein
MINSDIGWAAWRGCWMFLPKNPVRGCLFIEREPPEPLLFVFQPRKRSGLKNKKQEGVVAAFYEQATPRGVETALDGRSRRKAEVWKQGSRRSQLV